MKLFIIGNGFDIAHRLPTKYIHFRDYLEKIDWRFLTALETPYGLVSESHRDFVEQLLWREFETKLSSVNEDEIVDGALSIDMGLEGGDVDIEDTLNEYWEEQYEYIKHLNNYVKSWVEQIDINVQPITTKVKRYSDDLFLTFNYTLTLEKVYRVRERQILHIHGSVDRLNSGEPVIGHGDNARRENAKRKAREAAKNYWEKESSIYNALANYYDRTRKDVRFYLYFYKDFFDRLNLIDAVVVIGHSWGEVDMPYFRKILSNTKDNTIWHIYYFEDEEKIVFLNKALEIGIKRENIKMLNAKQFYDKK